MWKDLQYEWQVAFEEAWEAFRAGSTPIGGALFGADGRLVIRDRNRSAEPATVNRKISHAEANILRQLNTDEYPDYRNMILYTTMEPCPMCIGTILMANIKKVKYAAKDIYCGSVHMLDVDPYMSSKKVKCEYMGGEYELFQLTIQCCYELCYTAMGKSDVVLKAFRDTNPTAAAVAEELFGDGLLDRWKDEKTVAGVFDEICRRAGRHSRTGP